MAKHEIVNGVSYTPFIDPEFVKYEEKYHLTLASVLLSDLWDGARNKECTLDIPQLKRTSSVTLPPDDVLAKRDRCESKTRRKCNKYLKGLINWSELKRRGLVVGLKLKNQDIKNNKNNLSSPPSQNNKNKAKEIKLEGEIRISSSNGKKSRSPRPRSPKDSSKSKLNDKKEKEKFNLNKSDRKFRDSSRKRSRSRSSSPSSSPPRKPSKSNDKKEGQKLNLNHKSDRKFGVSSRKKSRSSSPSPSSSPPRKASKLNLNKSDRKFGNSRKKSRSRSSSPSSSPPRKPSKSSKKIKVEEINNVVKKKQKLSSSYQHRASISNSYENKYKNFKIPKKQKQETPGPVDLKKDSKRPKIISPFVAPRQTLPSTDNNVSNYYKIPKISKKPAVESTGKEKIKVAIANLFEIDNKHVTPNWDTSDSDSSDDEKEKQILLRPDPTLEEMSGNPAYTSFGKYLARPEKITKLDKLNFPSSNDGKSKAPFDVFEEVGQKVACWVLKDLKPSEYPPFECPEFEEDSISAVSSGDDDFGGEVDETLSDDDCEISFMDNGWGDAAGNKSKKVACNPGSDLKLIALEYCGRSLSLLDPQIGVNRRGVNNSKDKYFQILSVKPGTNYEKPTFQTKCMICQVLCRNVYELASHVKTDLHRKQLLDYSFELATDEEKIFAEARDFDELKRARREKRRQDRREYKAKYKTFSVPRATIKPAYSLSYNNENGQSTFSPPDAKRRQFVEVIKLE